MNGRHCIFDFGGKKAASRNARELLGVVGIKIGRRSIAQYFLWPLIETVQESMRAR